MRTLTIGFIGLGLIGGSIAKSIRLHAPHIRVIAYNRSADARIQAQNEHVADEVTDCIDDRFSSCDYIFLCTPVEHNITYLNTLKSIISPSCMITDVGSVKGNIHQAVQNIGLERNFIGGHPMAGSEKTGYENASPMILENAYYILTPTPLTPKESIAEFTSLLATIGAIPVQMEAMEHDYAVAAISHLPHLIAAKLVTLVKSKDSPNQTMKMLAAGGFKDITRIASSSPEMWTEICSTNTKNITTLLDNYIDELSQIRDALENKQFNQIFDLFTESRTYRNSFSDDKRGLIPKVYILYLDVADEFGAISNVAGILAEKKISIKNIGIVHNREFQDGVLRIEFYDQETLAHASTLLPQAGYTIYPNH